MLQSFKKTHPKKCLVKKRKRPHVGDFHISPLPIVKLRSMHTSSVSLPRLSNNEISSAILEPAGNQSRELLRFIFPASHLLWCKSPGLLLWAHVCTHGEKNQRWVMKLGANSKYECAYQSHQNLPLLQLFLPQLINPQPQGRHSELLLCTLILHIKLLEPHIYKSSFQVILWNNTKNLCFVVPSLWADRSWW